MTYHDPLCTIGYSFGDFVGHDLPMGRTYVLAVFAEENVSVDFGY